MSSTSKSNSSSKTVGVLDYIQSSLPKSALQQLYSDKTRGRYVCRAVLQSLSPVAQQVVLRLSCCGGTFSKQSLNVWCKHSHVVKELQQWGLLLVGGEDEKDTVTLEPSFAEGLSVMLQNASSCPWTALTEAQWETIQQKEGSKATKYTLEDLDRYTRTQWSTVLHFLVGTPYSQEPPPEVVHFLLQTKLMQTDPDYVGNDEDAPLVITRKGYDFMLQQPQEQVWHFCQQYLYSLEKQKKKILKEALLFLICLSFARVGSVYPSWELGKEAKVLVNDLSLFGLLRVQKVGKSQVFYPTRIAMHLLQGSAPSNTNSRKALEQDLQNPKPDASRLAIIVQTNFQLCAYTTSELHVSMLGLFCQVSTIRRLPNMVFMVITRDSVKSAFGLGITAQQILQFLEKHAHPNLLKSGGPLVPPNVVDQIWLWDRERHRVKWTEVYTHNCLMQGEFEAIKQYAIDRRALAWSSQKRNQVMIKYSQAERVLAFVRQWRAKASTERGE